MIQVSTADIPKHWGWVERGLQEIIRKTGEKWSPAHVSQALYENRAALFICDDGFVVLQVLPEDWTRAPYVHVWAAWFEPHKAEAIQDELIAAIDDIARQRGCGFWEWGSPRGWGRGLRGKCEAVRTVYRRKVE